jgi:hypothetical protein
MAMRAIDAIDQRLTVVLRLAEHALEQYPNRLTPRVFGRLIHRELAAWRGGVRAGGRGGSQVPSRNCPPDVEQGGCGRRHFPSQRYFSELVGATIMRVS